MLYHHDSRPYEVAVADVKKHIEEQIANGKAKAAKTVERLFTETPNDALAPLPKLEFIPREFTTALPGEEITHSELIVTGPGLGDRRMTPWAFGQMAEYLKTPPQFARELQARADWGAAALAELWQEIALHTPRKVLLRSVGDWLRGVVSDKFGRKDARPLVETCLGVIKEIGAIPVDGKFTDSRFELSFITTDIYNPTPDEFITFGGSIRGSDYGHGAVDISGLVNRPWCSNLAILTSELRSVHIGPRITETVLLSQETERLDLAALRSAVKDVMAYTLGPAREKYFGAIKEAAEKKLTATEVTATLARVLDTKAEVKAAEEKFASAEIELLPPGQNAWRLSNVLSLLARDASDPDTRIDYERAAGKIVMPDNVKRLKAA